MAIISFIDIVRQQQQLDKWGFHDATASIARRAASTNLLLLLVYFVSFDKKMQFPKKALQAWWLFRRIHLHLARCFIRTLPLTSGPCSTSMSPLRLGTHRPRDSRKWMDPTCSKRPLSSLVMKVR